MQKGSGGEECACSLGKAQLDRRESAKFRKFSACSIGLQKTSGAYPDVPNKRDLLAAEIVDWRHHLKPV